MAKKQSMNFFELHLEKIVLALSIIVGIVIIVLSFMSRGGESATALTEEAARKTESLAERRKKPAEQLPPPPELKAAEFIKISPLSLTFADDTPMGPPSGSDIKSPGLEQQIHVPQILALSNIAVEFQRTQVYISNELNQQQVKDIDFVTVEASFPLAQLRSAFEQEFKNPKLLEPVQYPEPIVAAVELQKSQLLPNGSWSEWEKVQRLEIDPMADKEISAENITEISNAEYEVRLQTSSNPETQLLILRPQPYKLVNDTWMTPSQKAEMAKLAKENERAVRPTPPRAAARGGRTTTARGGRTPAARGGRTTTARGGRTPATPRGARPGGAMGPGGMMGPMGPGGMMGPMGPGGMMGPMGPGGMMGPGGARPQNIPGGYGTLGPGGFARGTTQDSTLLDKDEITLWAHDADLKPGSFCRYRIKIGFFNPIFGKNWFEKDQQELNNKTVLWSEPAETEKLVYVPRQTLFFPNSGSATAQVVRVDVYRWQNGCWHSKSFPVTPGASIGQLYKPPVDKNIPVAVGASQQEASIDYRTGVTLLDIIPNNKHWCQIGSSFRDVTTNDILYRDTDGVVKRLGVDNRCWPPEMKVKRAKILQAIRNNPEKLANRG